MKKVNKISLIISIIVVIACIALFAVIFVTTNAKKDTKKKSTDSTLDPVIENAEKYVKLADYSKITVKKSEVKTTLKEKIDETLQSYTYYEKITKGKIKSGDTVNIYYVGKIDGKTFDGGSCTKKSNPEGYDLTIGSNSFIDDFEDQLIGKKIGDKCDVEVTFPDNYTQNEDLSGKDAVFSVTINSKQGKKIVPKLTDKFVKENLSGYKSAKDYKAKIRQSIVKSIAMTNIVSKSKIKKYPSEYMKATKKQLKTSIENYLSSQGLTVDDYIQNTGQSKSDYDDQLKKTAESNLTSQIVYYTILQKENKNITDKEYKEELDKYLKNYNVKKESELDKTFESNYGAKAKWIIYGEILYNKTADILESNIVEE